MTPCGKAARQLRAGVAHGRTDFDIVPMMLDHGPPKDIYQPDNLHMRFEGYALWTEAVRAAIFPDTEQQEQQCRRTLRH